MATGDDSKLIRPLRVHCLTGFIPGHYYAHSDHVIDPDKKVHRVKNMNTVHGKTYIYSTTIEQKHLDRFGHVNNAVYLQLFEDARWDVVTSEGFGYAEMERLQQGPVITEATIRYRREITLGEKITITSRCGMKSERLFITDQKMHNEKGELCSEAVFTGGLFDLKNRRIIEPTEMWLKAMGLG